MRGKCSAPTIPRLDCLCCLQAVAELAAAIAGGRAQAAGLTLVALERPAAQYQQLCSLTSVSLTVLDAFSDPNAWGSLLQDGGGSDDGSSSSTSSRSGSVIPLPGILAAPDGMQQLRRHLASAQQAAPGLRQCIVFDCLSPLLDRFGAGAVAHLLHSLQAAPRVSSLLCGVHGDLHTPQQLAALEQLAAGTLQLQPASELEQSLCAAAHGAGEPQGRLAVRLKRRAGRVRAEAQLYCLDGGGGLQFFAPPADALNPQAAAERAAAAGAGGGGAEGPAAGLAQQLAGGMKLGLSQAELEAKQRVQLPFEHQGQVRPRGCWRLGRQGCPVAHASPPDCQPRQPS